MRIAIIGGGIAGLAAAYELSLAGVEFVLFEAAERFGGIVETVRERGFIVECGPDAWLTERPWARELAVELGLVDELLPSNDATRKTYIADGNMLTAIPHGMRMMVPADLEAMEASSLFSDAAKRAYRAEPDRAPELKAAAPTTDESVASFVERHFGREVAAKIAAPLLAGIFGGDIARLSVQAVMPAFVKMEREHGSLIVALQKSARLESAAAIFTTLTSGMGTLVDRLVARLPRNSLRLRTPICRIESGDDGWQVAGEHFDALILGVPAEVVAALLEPMDATAAALLPECASSAIVVALGFDAEAARSMKIPRGFGFLVPQVTGDSHLMAATFTHQKFIHRAPEGAVLLRGVFGGGVADSLMERDDFSLAQLAREELARYLGSLPQPHLTVVRRWPRSLPQYEVGHLPRMAEFESRVARLPGLQCIGSAYHGVGLPDLVRDGRTAARNLIAP